MEKIVFKTRKTYTTYSDEIKVFEKDDYKAFLHNYKRRLACYEDEEKLPALIEKVQKGLFKEVESLYHGQIFRSFIACLFNYTVLSSLSWEDITTIMKDEDNSRPRLPADNLIDAFLKYLKHDKGTIVNYLYINLKGFISVIFLDDYYPDYVRDYDSDGDDYGDIEHKCAVFDEDDDACDEYAQDFENDQSLKKDFLFYSNENNLRIKGEVFFGRPKM